MNIVVENELQIRPLLEEKPKKTATRKAVRKAFKLSAHLANLLPTGSVLTFQTLAPIVTYAGTCRTQISRVLTWVMLSLCGISCFVLCFTDSFRDKNGKVRYGIATFSGLWVIDGSTSVLPEKASAYKARFIDVFHGFLSLAVFGTIAILDKNVVCCFYPNPSDNMINMLSVLPIAVGVLCSLLFGVFPTTRHGIGFPLSEE